VNGRLAAYPFERLARLKAQVTPPAKLPHIAMSIGFQHAAGIRHRHCASISAN
jgi:hypothetical protein